MSKRKPAIPAIPRNISPEMRPFFNAIRESLQVLGGEGRGNPLDVALTRRDLKNGTLISSLAASGVSVGGGGSTDIEVEIPTAPTGLVVVPGVQSVRASWDRPTYKGHKHTNVYIVLHPRGTSEHENTLDFSEASNDLSAPGQSAVIQALEYQWVSVFITHVNANGIESEALGPQKAQALEGDVVDPQIPTGVELEVVEGGFVITWDGALYAGHARTKIYADFVGVDDYGEPLRLGDFERRVLMWEGNSNGARISVNEGAGAYFWVTHENSYEIESNPHDPLGIYGYLMRYAETPTVPVSVTATAITGGIVLRWAGTSYVGHKHSNIYVQSDLPNSDGTAGSPPNLNQNTQLAQTVIGNIATVYIPVETGAYVWISNENILGEESAVHSAGGLYRVALLDVGTTLDRIRAGIDETFFTPAIQDLLSEAEAFDYTEQSDKVASIESNLNTQFGNNFANWSATRTLASNTNVSLGQIRDGMRVVAGDNSVTFTDFADVVINAENAQYVAQWGTKVNVNGTDRGVGFIATNAGGVDGSLFYMNADSVVIGDPASSSSAYPFVVQGGKTYINNAVIDSAHIGQLAVESVITSRDIVITDGAYVGGTLSTPRINVLADGTHNTSYKFSVSSSGHLRATNAYFSGTIEASILTGGTFRTSSSSSASRVVATETGVYRLWVGTGAQTDENAIMYLKGNGDAAYNGTLRVENLEGDVYDSTVKLIPESDIIRTAPTRVFYATLKGNANMARIFHTLVSVDLAPNATSGTRAVGQLYRNGVKVAEIDTGQLSGLKQAHVSLACSVPASASNVTIEVKVYAPTGTLTVPEQYMQASIFKSGDTFLSVST